MSTSHSIDEIGKKALCKIIRYVSILWQVFIQLIIYRPELCYIAITVRGIAFYKDSIIVLLVKLMGIKLVFHFHNKGISACQDRWFDNFLYKKVFNNAEAVLLSKYLYPDIRKYITEEHVHYCPNGIPVVKNKRHKLRKTGIVKVLFLSNLIESKGIFILLEACKLLKERGAIFHCSIVGGEGDITSEQLGYKINGLGLKNCVTYLGKKYGLEKENIFFNADIFVHPTLNDCFPLVLLEAMQYSLPIVSTFEGGIPDIVKDGVTGFLIPQRNITVLAEKLELLIFDTKLRKQMGVAGKEKFEKEFTIEKFENQMKNILQDIINKERL